VREPMGEISNVYERDGRMRIVENYVNHQNVWLENTGEENTQENPEKTKPK